MGSFNMPPGVSTRDIPGNSCDPNCLVCHQFEDNCICPPCTVCELIGEPRCYEDIEPDAPIKSHGMMLTEAQKIARAEYQRLFEENKEYYDANPEDERDGIDRDTQDFHNGGWGED